MSHVIAPRDTRPEHGALSQLHRWYELYEREPSDERIARQLEILDRDVIIESTRGTVRGHDEYLAAIATLPATDRNSHRVTRWSTEPAGADAIALSAETIHQRMQADGTLSSSALRYSARLLLTGAPAAPPVFQAIRISRVGPVSQADFVDAYPENRAHSFLHRWLAAIEDVGGPASAFDQLLSSGGFELAFSTSASPIVSPGELAEWLTGVAARIQHSSHRAEHVAVQPVDERHIAVSADLDWSGVDRAGRHMAGRTHHDWLLEETGERFLRMKRARAVQLVPMAVVGSGAQ